MELVLALKVLWRRKLVLAVGLLLAIGLIAKGSTQPRTHSALAWTRVALDTQPSQLIDPDPIGADSLPWRADLLTGLLSTEESKTAIARKLGAPVDELVVLEPRLATPEVGTPLPVHAVKAAATVAAPYVLIVQADGTLPLVSIAAAAPDRAHAAKLAQAAAATLEAASSLHPTRIVQGYVVEQVSPVRTKDIAGADGRVKAVGMALVLLAFWCACVALAAGLPRRRRASATLHPT
jgi:hypothetical protein